MTEKEFVKIVVFVPVTHGDIVRKAMGDKGAGAIGKYSHCTFSSIGTGRFNPLKGAHPFIGTVGKMEEVEEERIETVCEKSKAPQIISAMKKAHPYEEVAYDVYPLLQI